MADKIKFKKPVDFNGQTIENLNIPAEALAGKQDKLVAGDNITIDDNVISAINDSDVCVKKSGDLMTGDLLITSHEPHGGSGISLSPKMSVEGALGTRLDIYDNSGYGATINRYGAGPLNITADNDIIIQNDTDKNIHVGNEYAGFDVNNYQLDIHTVGDIKIRSTHTAQSGNGIMFDNYRTKDDSWYHGYYLLPANDGSTETSRYTLATEEKSVQKSGDKMTGDLEFGTNKVYFQDSVSTKASFIGYDDPNSASLTIQNNHAGITLFAAASGASNINLNAPNGKAYYNDKEIATQDWANNSFVKKGKLYEHRVQLSNSPISSLVYYSTFSNPCSRSDLENITDQILSGSFITTGNYNEETKCQVFFGGRRDDQGGSSGVWIYYLSETGAMTKITTSWNSSADTVTPII